MNKTYDKGSELVFDYVKRVFPGVSSRLKGYSILFSEPGDQELAKQAEASIRDKRFHCQGGGVYALYPDCDIDAALDFIVSLQTISDYLDNLCDRAGVIDEAAFRQLHLSMLDAVDLSRKSSDYYRYFPYKNDNGYLSKLVAACRASVSKPPSYDLVLPYITKYVQLYSDLQAYKHLGKEVREKCLETWAGYYLLGNPGISWYEFSAAAGSTLGIFSLFAAAFDPDLKTETVRQLDAVYFPWINGLHILLDYFIDASEDMQTGDLNFTSYYSCLKECEERIVFFYNKAVSGCKSLDFPIFHLTIINGLLAMYLSDPKAGHGMNRLASRNILKESGKETCGYHRLCRLLRFAGIL